MTGLQNDAMGTIGNAQANLKAVDGLSTDQALVLMSIAQAQCLAALTFAVMDVANAIRGGES